MCSDSDELFNVLHLVRMILLLVVYIFSCEYLKRNCFSWMANNKCLMQRRYFFVCLKRFMRTSLKLCVVLVLIIFAETCLI